MLSLSSSLYRTTGRSGSVGMRASEGGMVLVGEKKVKASDRPLIFDALSGTTFPGPLLSLGAPSAIVETICGGERCTSSPIQSLRTALSTTNSRHPLILIGVDLDKDLTLDALVYIAWLRLPSHPLGETISECQTHEGKAGIIHELPFCGCICPDGPDEEWRDGHHEGVIIEEERGYIWPHTTVLTPDPVTRTITTRADDTAPPYTRDISVSAAEST
ncbi:hypothetical protein PLEOSDRAFT_153861 [Pleurotus ostreatus PC15]|uniref:Uncharacterized protein n=1 Tax=Pleurotus ostreatus (strain PC15) TaxID=1137138 RepID=A0A067NU86_PLEO1|nr:hypothetical protein PLEOSDRAFT_153861 [Pleurotus ostreatus PC15]